MKNFYFLALFVLCSNLTLAQTHISFEADEGFELGSIHDQNGWEVTESESNGYIENQVITDDFSSDGDYSFKNGYEPDYDWQYFPIFGATQLFDDPIDYTEGFTLSYDVMVTDQLGSDFEFVLFAADESGEWTPIAGVGTENRGYFYLIKDADYDFEYAEIEWEPNEWNTIKIEVSEDTIDYYINDELEYSVANFSHLDILGFNMLHNNYGEDAYYDNFVFEAGGLGVESLTNNGFTFYPNPAEQVIHLEGDNTMQGAVISVHNLLGQEVIRTTYSDQLDVSSLASGTYLLKAEKVSGETQTRKLIKK